MLDAFLILLNVAAFVGYGTIPLDVFFPQRTLLTDWLPPGESLSPVEPSPKGNAHKARERVVGEPPTVRETESR